jgi:hypothetical protein
MRPAGSPSEFSGERLCRRTQPVERDPGPTRTAMRIDFTQRNLQEPKPMPRYRRLLDRATLKIAILVGLAAVLGSNPRVTATSVFAQVNPPTQPDKYLIDFSSYNGGSVEEWLKSHGYRLERDAKDRKLLELSVTDKTFNIEAKGRMSGLILNDSVNLDKVKRIKLTWGINRYPKDVSYSRQVNNEALMLYIFFGSEKTPSGHILIPNSPYFIGLFLCQDDQINFPYVGRYFREGGRFVCLGKPPAGTTVVSEFDLDSAYRSYFKKSVTPEISGIAFGIDTSKSGDGGRAAAFIKAIQFIPDASKTP